MSTDHNNTASESDFEHIGLENLSISGSEFTIIQATTSTSEWEAVTDATSSSRSPKERPQTPTAEGASTIRPESPNTIFGDRPSDSLTIDNLSLKTIDEIAGGSIHKYQQLLIADLKRKRGLAFTTETAIPFPGELIGDRKPGYEKMSLGAKFWSWWTKKELQVFEAQILKELRAHDEENKTNVHKEGNSIEKTCL
ncbi:hypothetical protein N431DRAFT_444938 [Stipitochalara longipes BDJ]|nr:hypothetical protein N431DRAFT_444938 [Stipitochalara longipes BDJ]